MTDPTIDNSFHEKIKALVVTHLNELNPLAIIRSVKEITFSVEKKDMTQWTIRGENNEIYAKKEFKTRF